jgi:hypothetical protein
MGCICSRPDESEDPSNESGHVRNPDFPAHGSEDIQEIREGRQPQERNERYTYGYGDISVRLLSYYQRDNQRDAPRSTRPRRERVERIPTNQRYHDRKSCELCNEMCRSQRRGDKWGQNDWGDYQYHYRYEDQERIGADGKRERQYRIVDDWAIDGARKVDRGSPIRFNSGRCGRRPQFAFY